MDIIHDTGQADRQAGRPPAAAELGGVNAEAADLQFGFVCRNFKGFPDQV